MISVFPLYNYSNDMHIFHNKNIFSNVTRTQKIVLLTKVMLLETDKKKYNTYIPLTQSSLFLFDIKNCIFDEVQLYVI